MALLAVGAQFELMRVLMATIAIAERHSGKLLERLAVAGLFFMAFDTVHRFVFALQGEVGFIVVELRCRLKIRGGMAFCAIVGQCFLVVIFVAGNAIPAQAQISFAAFF